jgi:hypothetical protein
MVIIAVAVSVLVIAVVVSAPLNPINFRQQEQVPMAGQNRLNLNFDADIGDINIYTNLTGGDIVAMDVSATGGTSLFGGNQPVIFTVENHEANGTQMVTADVSAPNEFPFSGNLKVVCNIYVNPAADLMIDVNSKVGNVYVDAASEAKFSALNLRTATGDCSLNLKEDAEVNGALKLSTATGNVWFTMNEATINGNYTVTLDTGTGNVNINITQTEQFNANLQVNGHTGTGEINLDGLTIDGEVAAKIQSNTGLGQIHVNVENFNGNQSPIQSNNYPSSSNINMNFNTGIGNINLKATYKTTIQPTISV